MNDPFLTLDPEEPATVPAPAAPLPHTPTRVDQLTLAVNRRLRQAWRLATGPAWWMTRQVVLRPTSSVVLLTGVVTATPVTWSHVTGGVIGGAVILVSNRESRVRLSTLHDLSKYRKRRRRISRRWVTAFSDAALAKPGTSPDEKRVPKLRGAVPTAVGVRLDVDGSNVGAGLTKIAGHADSLRASFGARDLDITPHPRHASRVIFDLAYDDPFAKIIQPELLPAPTKKLHVVTGLDKFGRGVEKALYLPNLVVGMQGAGKSSEVWMILYALIQAGIPFRVRVFDPKGGQEFADLEDAAYEYERDPGAWPDFLERAWGALSVRQGVLRAAGLRKNPFTQDNPLDVMIIDELLTAMAFSDAKTKVTVAGRQMAADRAFLTYLSTARSAGFTVLACSQLSQKGPIGDVRDMFPYVTCLRVMSDDIVRAVLGDPKLYPAHELPRTEETSGIGFMVTDRGVVKYRAAYLDDAARLRVARQVAVLQQPYKDQRAARAAKFAEQHGAIPLVPKTTTRRSRATKKEAAS